MRRHVLHVTASTDRRGAETFAADLDTALTARGRASDLVALAPGAQGGTSARPLGRRRFDPAGLWRLRRLCASSATVVGHGSSTLPACALATAGTSAAFVYRNIGDPEFWAGTPARRARVRWLLSRADLVAALWQGSADALIRSFGVPASKLVVIPNGRPAAEFPLVDHDRRSMARERLGLAGPVVVYLGALGPEKRVDVIIRAVGRLVDATLVVAGDGPLRSRLEQLAVEELGGNARFLGAVASAAPVLAAADVVVLASQTEGLPAVLIEAGLSGLPVVSTDVGGVSTIVEDGVTGSLVPPGNPAALAGALGSVLAAPADMGQKAHVRCMERFEMQAVSDRWDDLLQTVIRPR